MATHDIYYLPAECLDGQSSNQILAGVTKLPVQCHIERTYNLEPKRQNKKVETYSVPQDSPTQKSTSLHDDITREFLDETNNLQLRQILRWANNLHFFQASSRTELLFH